MQNRGALWIFTILLALACAYQLSFSFFTSRVEGKARTVGAFQADSVIAASTDKTLERGPLLVKFENDYLRAHGEERIYPVLGYTYRECKEKEINLGLDLKGGMAVTLEVSIPDLVANLSENNTDPAFTTAMANARKAQLASSDDFITLFAQEYAKVPNRPPLSAIFYSPDRQTIFDREGNDEDYIKALRKEAETALNNTERILRTRIDKFGVAQPGIQKQQFSGRIQIELPGVKDKERVRRVLQSTANLEFWETLDNTDIGPILDQVNQPLSQLLYPELNKKDSSAVDSLGNPIDTATATAAVVDSTKKDSLVTDDSTAAPVDTALMRAEASKRAPLASKLMLMVGQRGWSRGPMVGQADLKDTAEVKRLLAMEAVTSALPADLRLAWGSKPQAVPLNNGTTGQMLSLYALKIPRDGKPRLDGSSISSASQDFDMKGSVEVRMSMNPEGAQIWALMTAENVGRSVAIVLDGLVYSAPEVRSEIRGGNSSIEMGSGNINKQIQEADDLANILKAGALPAPARIIDETIVGPSLGEENISTGLNSFVIALILVLVYMALYYARAGWVADLALIVNLFVLIGSLASLQAALTLPGIAGIVLTMGMAVDANVLIYERVREELRHGKMMKSALDLGYKGALSAIIDGNVTTMIIAVVLLIFGSGPIQGFAVTLGLGILTSLFTALFLSRLITSARVDKGKSFAVWNNWSKNIFVNAKYDFMGKRKYFYIFSGLLITAGIVSMFTNGFNWGVDFTGGRTYVVKFTDDVNVAKVRAALDDRFVDDAGIKSTVNVKTYGSDRQLKVTTNYLINQADTAADNKVDARLREGLATIGVSYEVGESRKVDPTISDDIKGNAITSLTISLILIFLYIAVRFRNWQFGLGGLLSLVHDALVVLGLYSLLYKVLPISLEIDEAFIAAILTVIGYSINDTVIVFDRIREYMRDHKRDAYPVVINKAINSTLGRTMNTSLTTLLVLVIIFIFGGVSIKAFVFALLIGIGVGTYSSVFVASSIVADLLKRKDATQN
ncbi:MAG: protein translocase subunit SecDF [Flavobacteriales bacterium]|nr:protein translocase subunit SecDF [Flavobacteriales bacterium]MCC6937735.1 protein translocase subunit SecDF [Flavobacteriales bacterium]